jgi:hypothetical protein
MNDEIRRLASLSAQMPELILVYKPQHRRRTLAGTGGPDKVFSSRQVLSVYKDAINISNQWVVMIVGVLIRRKSDELVGS